MTLSECYQLLGLDIGASFEEVKTSYRRLVRRYHPDVNPSNPAWAQEKFIELTDAYQYLIKTLNSPKTRKNHQDASRTASNRRASNNHRQHSETRPSPPESPSTRTAHPPVEIRPDPNLSDIDNHLKKTSYRQLQEFLRTKRFARAIALVEGLAQRIPSDPEVKQWQAIAYQQYARYFTTEHQYAKAHIYLKKALRVDPNNRKLWSDIKQDFDRLEQTHLRRQV